MADKAEQLKKKFKATDKNGDGKLDFDEMCELLRQGNPNMKKAELMKLFNKVDTSNDGFIEFDEFVDYLYAGKRTSEARNVKLAAQGKGNGEEGPWDDVEAVLRLYDAQANGLDNKEFSSILTDCKIFTRKFSKQDADVVFAKVCPKGQRKIGLAEFKEAVRIIATKKDMPTIEVQTVIGARASEGKIINATKADDVRFHDDKSLYTGAHAKNETHGSAVGGESADARRERRQSEADAALAQIGAEADWGDCEAVFLEYGEGNGCDNKEFVKLLTDCGLLNKKCSKTDADLVFSAVCPKGQRKLQMLEFKQALKKLAVKHQTTIAEIQSTVGSRAGQGKVINATESENVRFFNEKDQTLEGGTMRHSRLAEEKEKALAAVGEEADWGDCEVVYKTYDSDNNGIDNREFAKMLTDTSILVGKKFQKTDADLVFSAVCPKGQRKLNFDAFKKALKMIATKKECTIADLQGLVGARAGQGKVIKATEAEAVRFHDDKSLYTGAHADAPAGGRHDKLASQAAAEAADVGEEADWGDVERAFKAYDKEGNGMDTREFNAMMKDCGILDSIFVTADSDIIFSKAVPKGKRKVGLDEFKQAMRFIAAKKKCPIADVQAKIGARSDGPLLSGTKAEANRFHDSAGPGPSAADRRSQRGATEAAAREGLGLEVDWAPVEQAFKAYDPQGNGLDSKEFQKVLWDADLIDSQFKSPDADVVFAKFKTRKLGFEEFKEALRCIAMKKGCPIAEIQDIIGARGEEGMKLNGTQADAVRFHDDKSTYTGMHAA